MPDPAPLPAIPPQIAARGWGRCADALAIGLVVFFGFWVASFTARNSDLWLHLATGRLVANGEYRFGTDPFTYTAAGKYWPNHAWLFDLGLFLAHKWFGGATLVALKAVAVAVTAGLMLRLARGAGPQWVATGCVLLAVLAMSPRLLLQPAIASLLMLAGCLCCLRAGGKAFRAVPVLIAVWVNVDAWFVLGPAVVGLYWLGRRLEPDRASLPPWPNWLFPAALGACLLSPHHVFALQLPLELSPAVHTSAFGDDPRFVGLFASPFRFAFAQLGPSGGYNPSAWAFLVLFALGVLSFAVNRSAVRSWRFAVWLPFAALAAWQARAIPFFAVVAGPIVALNLREVIPLTVMARAGRGLVLGAALAVLALGWFGWTTGVNTRDRGVAWAVRADPTLVRATEGVRRWRHATGIAPEARVFPTHPDVGHYLAWFTPGERYFLDSRLTLFASQADDYLAVAAPASLLPADGPSNEVLCRHNVAAVLVYDPDRDRMTRGLATSADGRWQIARVDGGAVLLVPSGTAGERFDPVRAAFGGATELPLPGTGPTLSEPTVWWRTRPETGRAGSWEADAAAIYLRLAETDSSKSPALPLLAIRAARSGLEVDPRDPAAWLVLGQAYLSLGIGTWEREAGNGLTPLEHVRFLQATGALVQAVQANPDDLAAHESLTRLFLRRNMLDLAHRHATAAEGLVRRSAARTGEPLSERAGQLIELTGRLDRDLKDAQNRFLIRSTGLTGDPLAQARIAAGLGLTQKAVDVLLASHPDLYGSVGLGLLADLLLQTGQVVECRTLLDRDELRRNPHVLGFYNLPRKPNADGTRWTYRFHAYDWLDLCQCAVAGRYADADAAINRLSERLESEELPATRNLAFNTVVALTGEVGQSVPPLPLLNRTVTFQMRVALTGLWGQAKALSIGRADLLTLAGVLELERGALPAAAERFGAALPIYKIAEATVPNVSRPGEPLAARYHEALGRR